MSKNKPLIVCRTVEEFQKIENALKTLSPLTYELIETVSYGALGFVCSLKYDFCKEQKIYLPKTTTQIKDFDGYIGIYSKEFFFKIEGDMYRNCYFEYIFV